jgi:hypothetical protein
MNRPGAELLYLQAVASKLLVCFSGSSGLPFEAPDRASCNSLFEPLSFSILRSLGTSIRSQSQLAQIPAGY